MAVNFQRRNIGVLADTPTFEDVGRSAYTDYAAEFRRTPASVVMPAAVKAADIEKTPALAGPQTPEAMAEYEAAQTAALKQAEEAALRQLNSVKNPLNVVGNAISAVVGTPFRLLENAIGGGNNDLAAPFRPNQTAQDRYKSTLADISTGRLTLAQTMDGLRANQTQAMTNVLTKQSEQLGDLNNDLATMARNARLLQAQGKDPFMAFERMKDRMMADPVRGPLMQKYGYDEMPWYEGLDAELARGKDAVERLDKTGKITNNVLPYNSTMTQTDEFGNVVAVIQQDGSISKPEVSSSPQEDMPSLEEIDAAIRQKEEQATDGVTMPEPPPPVGQVQKVISAQEYARMETALGPQGAQNWMRQNNIQGVAN